MIREYNVWGLIKENGVWRPVTGKETHPVVRVSWYGAHEYTRWLSQQTSQNWRLPTEAEWEYAAGGGPVKRTKYGRY